MLGNNKMALALITGFLLVGCGGTNAVSDHSSSGELSESTSNHDEGGNSDGGNNHGDGESSDNEGNEGNHNDGGGSSNGGGSTTLPTTYQASSGRILGAQCAQCHGTNGRSSTSWDGIAGEGEFATEGFGGHPIMKAIADGYTPTEKRSIDGWLNSL